MRVQRDEPILPPWLRRPLLALWISLGLHGALIALVQVAPPAAATAGSRTIEARLVPRHAAPVAVTVPPLTPTVETLDAVQKAVPLLAPSVTAEALPAAAPEPVSTPADVPAPASAAEPAAPGAILTSAVDLTYYSVRELDVQPRALREIVPEYPVEADRRRVSGKLRLQLKLEADGRVSAVEVVSADPPGMFDDSALRAFRDERFAPAQKGGRPVRARVLIEVVYDWEGRRKK